MRDKKENESKEENRKSSYQLKLNIENVDSKLESFMKRQENINKNINRIIKNNLKIEFDKLNNGLKIKINEAAREIVEKESKNNRIKLENYLAESIDQEKNKILKDLKQQLKNFENRLNYLDPNIRISGNQKQVYLNKEQLKFLEQLMLKENNQDVALKNSEQDKLENILEKLEEKTGLNNRIKKLEKQLEILEIRLDSKVDNETLLGKNFSSDYNELLNTEGEYERLEILGNKIANFAHQIKTIEENQVKIHKENQMNLQKQSDITDEQIKVQGKDLLGAIELLKTQLLEKIQDNQYLIQQNSLPIREFNSKINEQKSKIGKLTTELKSITDQIQEEGQNIYRSIQQDMLEQGELQSKRLNSFKENLSELQKKVNNNWNDYEEKSEQLLRNQIASVLSLDDFLNWQENDLKDLIHSSISQAFEVQRKIVSDSYSTSKTNKTRPRYDNNYGYGEGSLFSQEPIGDIFRENKITTEFKPKKTFYMILPDIRNSNIGILDLVNDLATLEVACNAPDTHLNACELRGSGILHYDGIKSITPGEVVLIQGNHWEIVKKIIIEY